jgi:hypothetical protein
MVKSRFKYKGGGRTAESVSRRASEAGQTFDRMLKGVTSVQVKEGENQFRILPATWEDQARWGDSWEIPVYVHYGIGPDKGTYLCPAKMLKKRCPICEARAESDDEEEQSALRVTERRLAYVIDRDNEKAGPQVWSIPATLYKDIASRSIDKKTKAVLLIDSPTDGYDLMFTRTGTDKRTKYSGVEFDRDPTELHSKGVTMDRWLDFIQDNPLPDTLKFYDEAYLDKLLAGQSTKKEEDDDDEDEGSSRSRRRRSSKSRDEEEEETPRTRRRSKPEEDEEEEDTPRRRRKPRDEEEEEEEEETPRSRRRKSELDEEEEEEAPRSRRKPRDEEEEEEEEEEAPRSRRKPREDEEALSRVGRGKKKPRDEEEEEEEEDEHPSGRRRAGRSSRDEDEEIPFEEEPEEEEEDKGRLSRLKKKRSGK